MIQIAAKVIDVGKFLETAKNGPVNLRKAAATTLNETLVKSQSIMAKQASIAYNITQRDIRASFRSHSANYNDLNAWVESKGPKFPLFKFGVVARKEQRVVISEVRGTSTPVAHGFMAIVGSGHAGIFIRTGRKRFPIREMMGGAAPQMILAKRNWLKIDAELQRYFASRLLVNTAFFAR
jgi:hypothetical protein